MRTQKNGPTSVTLISDATGSLGEHVLTAIFTQFPQGSFNLTKLNFVNSQDALKESLKQLESVQGLVVHATVYDEYKQQIEDVCRKYKLPVYDLTGPIMNFLSDSSGKMPEVGYEKLHALTPDYFSRIVAIEFAIAHDDSAGLRTLNEADVILTGVSRTTKTPTSMVLAMKGYQVANIPIVPNVDPPKELLDSDPSRVVCFTIEPYFLSEVRSGRVKTELGFEGKYTDMPTIRQELTTALTLAKKYSWHVFDITGHAIEEIAARVIRQVKPRQR